MSNDGKYMAAVGGGPNGGSVPCNDPDARRLERSRCWSDLEYIWKRTINCTPRKHGYTSLNLIHATIRSH